jgi:hypothetical protein
MPRLIKQLQNNRSVIFDSGKFDDWCVYVVESNGSKKAPFDETYFSDLYQISQSYPSNKVYNDFVMIYERTTRNIDNGVLTLIDEIVATYNDEHKIIVEQWLTVIYAGMIAEENKENAILKKRVKRLGMHQVLVLNMPAKVAAKFSYGKKWRELDAIMRPLGF